MAITKTMTKKGFFFTLAAIALSVIIIFSFKVYTQYGLIDKMESIETRINTINNLIKDIESDVDNAIFTAGFRSLLSLEDYMGQNDDFINNLGTTLSVAFDEVFRQGTINSEKMGLMEDNTFINWNGKMKDHAAKMDINLDFEINSVTISHSDPWIVEISVDMDIVIEDNKNIAKWTLDKTYTRKISIIDFVDPLYLVNNDGIVNNTIRKTTVPDFLGGNLVTHLNNHYYTENTDAPSYLMRFENNLASSEYGIESLANVDLISSLGLGPSGKTAVDHLYFDPGSGTTDCIIEGMEISHPWFYLDYLPNPPNHLVSFYGRICDT